MIADDLTNAADGFTSRADGIASMADDFNITADDLTRALSANYNRIILVRNDSRG